jgi:biopolymer transport protein ExbD/biopolymer transport protein TolR
LIAKRRRRETHAVNAEINLTNLIDIAFVLLIIFMITAPILQGGVVLELPKGETSPIESNDAVIVSMTTGGKIFIDKAEVSMNDLGEQMKRFVASNKTVSFRADRSVPYGDAARALSIMKKVGVTNLDLVLEQQQDGQ